MASKRLKRILNRQGKTLKEYKKEKGKKDREKRNVKKSIDDAKKNRLVGTITIKYFYKLKNSKGEQYDKKHISHEIFHFDTATLKMPLDKYVEKCRTDVDDMLESESYLWWHELCDPKIDKYEYREPQKRLAKIQMRDAYHLDLDGDKQQTWDRKMGTCVFDYIMDKYGKIKGFIKELRTHDALVEIFRGYDDIEDTYLYDDPITNGVSTEQIARWCILKGVPMYACDENDKIFMIVNEQTENKFKRNHYAPALCFRLLNNHFYPFEDSKKTKSTIRQGVGMKSDNANVFYKKEGFTKGEKETIKDIEVVETDDTKKFLVEKIIESHKIPFPFNEMKYDGSNIIQFTLNGITYMLNQDITQAKKVCENMGREFKGQSLTSVMFDIIDEVCTGGLTKSTPNPHVFKSLTQEAVKARTHYGCVNEYMEDGIMTEWRNGDAQVCDIRKQYTSCMYEPKEEWIILNFNDEWEKYDGNMTLGLYYVKTNDTTLMHGDNIYSTSILKKAMTEKIKFKIIAQLKPSQKAPKSMFKAILDKFVEVSGGDVSISKKLANTLSGMLGKHKTRKNTLNINSDYEQVMNWFVRNGQKDKQIYIEDLDIDGKKYYMYGLIIDTMLSSNHLPNYIQMKDDANIRLYDMIKEMGGTLAFRKTDMAITIGGKYPPLEDKWGGYRKEDPPSKLGNAKEYNTIPNFEWEIKWNNHAINNSTQWEDMLNIAKRDGGVLMEGEAGTGKCRA